MADPDVCIWYMPKASYASLNGGLRRYISQHDAIPFYIQKHYSSNLINFEAIISSIDEMYY